MTQLTANQIWLMMMGGVGVFFFSIFLLKRKGGWWNDEKYEKTVMARIKRQGYYTPDLEGHWRRWWLIGLAFFLTYAIIEGDWIMGLVFAVLLVEDVHQQYVLSSKYPRNTGDSEYEEKWRVFGIAYMVKKGDSHEWVRAMADEEEDEEEEYSFRMAMEGLGIIAVVGIVLAYLISSYYERWTFTNCMIWVGISLLITWASSAEKLGMNVFHYPISKRMIRIGYSVVLALTIFISLPRVSDWVPQFIEDCLGFACFIGTGVFLGTFLWTKEDDDESKPVYYVRVDHSDPSTSTDEL